MAHSYICSGATDGYPQSTTASFVPIGVTFSNDVTNTSESQEQIVQRTAGTYTNLTANCTVHTSNTVITLHKNASATGINETITIAGTGLTSDTTHSDAVAAGDKWNYALSALASTFTIFSNTFAATTNTACRLVGFLSVTMSGTTTQTLSGVGVKGTSAAHSEMTIEKAGTFTNLAANVTPNTAGAGSFIRTAKGATPTAGNCSITLNGAGTGILEDTTDIDNISAGDLWCTQEVLASGTGGYTYVAVDYTTTTGDSLQSLGWDSATGFSVGRSTTLFFPLGTYPTSSITTETHAQCPVKDTYLFNNYGVNCTTFVNTDTWTLRTGASTNQITMSVNGTGQTLNTTNTYTSLTTDLVDFELVTGSTNGSRLYSAIWIHANLGGAAAIVYPKFFTVQNQGEFLPGLIASLQNRPPMFVT